MPSKQPVYDSDGKSNHPFRLGSGSAGVYVYRGELHGDDAQAARQQLEEQGLVHQNGQDHHVELRRGGDGRKYQVMPAAQATVNAAAVVAVEANAASDTEEDSEEEAVAVEEGAESETEGSSHAEPMLEPLSLIHISEPTRPY